MGDSNKKNQTIAKNTAFLFIRMIFVMCVSLYTSRITLRCLGFENFGIYNVVGSVVVFFSFLQSALKNATSRYLTYEIGIGNSDKIKQIYSMAINSHFLLAIILLIILEAGGVWFINNKLEIDESRLMATNWVFQFSLLTFFISIVRMPFESNVISHERMSFYAILSIAEVVLKLAVVFSLVYSTIDKLIIYSILLFLVALIIFICYIFYCKKTFKDCYYMKYWDVSILKQFCTYSGWSLLVNSSCVMRNQCISIFFNQFLGIISNAALGITNQVVGALNAFVVNFTQAYTPQIIKSYASQDYNYFLKLIFAASKLSYLLLLLISAPILLNLDFILSLWLDDYPAMTPIYIQSIIVYYLIDALQMPLVNAVHATGNLKTHQIMMSAIVFMVIPVTYITLKLGYDGSVVLWISSIANIVCAIVRIVYMQYLINLPLAQYLKDVIFRLVLITAILLPIMLVIINNLSMGWICLIVSSCASTIIVIIGGFYIGLTSNERQVVMKFPIINKIFKTRK